MFCFCLFISLFFTIPVRPITSKSTGLAADDQSEISFLISRWTLSGQSIFVGFVHRNT